MYNLIMESQTTKIHKILSEGRPIRTDEIMDRVYGNDHLGLARIGARIWDIKKKGIRIESWPDKEHSTLWWYAIIPSEWGDEYNILVNYRGLDKETAYYEIKRKHEIVEEKVQLTIF